MASNSYTSDFTLANRVNVKVLLTVKGTEPPLAVTVSFNRLCAEVADEMHRITFPVNEVEVAAADSSGVAMDTVGATATELA
jgi:hypothetical protein